MTAKTLSTPETAKPANKTTPSVPVAVAQPLAVPGDVDENLRRIGALVDEAARRGARLVIFSECAITAYDLKNVAVGAAISTDDPRLEALERDAKRDGIAIVCGLYERAGRDVFNSAIAFLPDGRRIVQRKHNIVGHEREHTTVTPGERQRVIFDVAGLRTAILICADNGIPGIHAELAAAGCDAVLSPTAGCGSASVAFRQHELKDPARRDAYLRAAESVCFLGGAIKQALELDMGLACTNQAGWDEASDFFQPGHSGVIDRTGHVTALISGQFVAEHLRPELAIGFLSPKTRR